MPLKRFPTWYSKDLPQCLQNWLYSHQYSEVADVTVGEGVVERVISRNTIIVALKGGSEVQIILYKVNHKNEPYFWEARRALHQMLVNQKVYVISLAEESPDTLFADVHLPSGHSASEMLLMYGLASLQHCPKLPKKEFKYLTEIENKARTEKRGIWGLDHKEQALEVFYINQLLFEQIACVVYKIEDVSRIHMVTTPGNFCISVTVQGKWNVIKAKKQKMRARKKRIAREKMIARQNMIARKCLLYKSVSVKLLKYDICANRFTGRIIEPQLAELSNALQNEETFSVEQSRFTASVISVLNGNSFTLRIKNNVIENIFLSYIMFPWHSGDMKHLCSEKIQNLKLVSMYYTHKLRLDTREFLRKLLVGKRVEVTVDYLDGFKGIYCTMTVFKTNVARVLIENGYAYVDIVHSYCPYREEYLAVENDAKKRKVGMHAPPQQSNINVAWCMNNVLLVLDILKKQQKATVVVEQVLSPSYIILLSVELGWLFAFSLIDFEKVRRANTGISRRNWKERVTGMIAEMCLQKQVSFQATSVDSNGVLHGHLKMANCNLRKLLLRKMGNRTSANCGLEQSNPVLDARRRRATRKHNQYLSSRRDAAMMQKIKQWLRRDVKTLASLPFSFSPSSPYFISNKKKRKRITTHCHFEQQYKKPMTAELHNTQGKNKVKRGKNQKKRRGKALQEKSLNQQTGVQLMVKRYKKTNQMEQIKDIMEQIKATAIHQQENKVFKKKWKEVKNKVTLRWCCF